MKRSTLLAILIAGFLTLGFGHVGGFPSGGRHPPTFTFERGYWYDSWGFNRNNYRGDDGYLPNIAYETLGSNRELAYRLGEGFSERYSSRVQRAQAILQYVQQWTEYGYDVDNVVMNGEPQVEWAWNADEMAHMFNTTINTVAVGDCEDMAFLCATLYLGAGYDAAMVEAPGHVALLIWLPEYPNANYYWDIPNDGRRAGWIWVEATGETNPLGWTPPDFNDGGWTAYPLALMIPSITIQPSAPQANDEIVVTASVISAKASVTQVLLHYSIQGGMDHTLTMTVSDSAYEAVIPKQPTGTKVRFTIVATDSEGNTRESEEVTFTVGMTFNIPDVPLELLLLIGFIAIIVLVLLMRGTR